MHSWRDPRIFDKECRSLAKENFEVFLITPDGINKKVDGVSVLRLSAFFKIRFFRVSLSSYLIVKQALALNPQVIQFHDPEIIPFALMFKKRNVKFIYDIHENYVTDIKQKKYVPFFLKNIFAFITRFFERRASKSFTTIIAEKYYARIFPRAIEVLNYPILDWSDNIEIDSDTPSEILYTGNITKDRGALIHGDILKNLDKLELSGMTMIGRCERKLVKKIRNRIGEDNFERLNIIGVDSYVGFDQIIEEYKKRNWIAGLALFPKTPHFAEKHLTKFFEYMAAGIPIIYSNYEEWENLLKPLHVGFSVDPSDSVAIAAAINKLKSDHELRHKMSKNGKEAVKHLFNWRNEERKLIKLMHSLTRRQPRDT